jgi:amidase
VAEATDLFEQLVWTVMSSTVDEDTWALAKAVAEAPAADDEPLLFRGGRATALYHRDWVAKDEARQRQRQAWSALFEDVDVLLCPVFPVAAFPHQVDDDPVGILNRTLPVGDRETPHGELTHWCGVVGVAYLPATVVPVGFTGDGRPVGIQVVADFLRDRTALAAAAGISDALGGFTPPPGYGA